jgi:NADPH:quinone reductase-like Zn-dependent oxidoreductase
VTYNVRVEDSMKAVVQQRYGGSEQLLMDDVTAPQPGPNDVLVRVRAAGVDRGTWHLMTGLPYAVRIGFGLRRPKFSVPGRDVAGLVEAVGDEVTRVAVGDAVIGTANGAFAELAVVPERRVAHAPTGLPMEEAAVLPISGMAALQAVRDAGRVRAGQQVLVIGASGGVGSYAVQIAADAGADVTGVASGAKAGLVRELGASRVIDYTREDIDRDGKRYDVIIDLAGNRPLRQLRRVLAPTGTLVIAGGEDGGRWLGGTQRQLAAMARSPFSRQRLTGLLSRENGEDLATLSILVEQGRLRPALERTYGLHEAGKAIDHIAAGHVRGKVALTV